MLRNSRQSGKYDWNAIDIMFMGCEIKKQRIRALNCGSAAAERKDNTVSTKVCPPQHCRIFAESNFRRQNSWVPPGAVICGGRRILRAPKFTLARRNSPQRMYYIHLRNIHSSTHSTALMCILESQKI